MLALERLKWDGTTRRVNAVAMSHCTKKQPSRLARNASLIGQEQANHSPFAELDFPSEKATLHKPGLIVESVGVDLRDSTQLNRLSKLPMLSAFGHKRSVDGVNLLDPTSFYFSLPGLPAMFSTQNSSGRQPTGSQTPQV